MQWHWALAGLSACLFGLLGSGFAAAQETGRHFGASVGAGLAMAPLGDLAGSFGANALPGGEVAVRLYTRSFRGNEWSVGLLSDRYRMHHVADLATRSEFDYQSNALLVGRSWSEHVRGAPLRFGLDAGWRRFDATSTRPDILTADTYTTRVRGDAAVLGVLYGLDLARGTTGIMPRLRLEMSYPDFGGGDGYSGLHRTSDLGFRASFGVELRQGFVRR
jgi:hypothetical protein